jgi:hypothetical protein
MCGSKEDGEMGVKGTGRGGATTARRCYGGDGRVFGQWDGGSEWRCEGIGERWRGAVRRNGEMRNIRGESDLKRVT